MLVSPKGKKRGNSPTHGDMSAKKAKALVAAQETRDAESKENVHVETNMAEPELGSKGGKKISPSSKPKSKKRSILYKAHKKPSTKGVSASEPSVKKSSSTEKPVEKESKREVASKSKHVSPRQTHSARLPSPTTSSSQSSRSVQTSFARPKALTESEAQSPTMQLGTRRQDLDSIASHASAKKSASDKSSASFSFSTIASKSPAKTLDMSSEIRHLSYDTLLQKYEALNESYERLAALRETKAEELLASYRESAEARHQASDRIIANLKEQLSKVSVEMEASRSLAQSQTKQFSLDKESSQMVEFLCQLTGLTASMTLDANRDAVWQVAQKTKSGKGVFEYILFQQVNSHVFQYQPVSLAAGASRKGLPANPPEFLLEEIEFDERQLSTFFHRVSRWLLG